jgi:hypothetical protein
VRTTATGIDDQIGIQAFLALYMLSIIVHATYAYPSDIMMFGTADQTNDLTIITYADIRGISYPATYMILEQRAALAINTQGTREL